jgi:hypothetical protein
MIQYAILTIIMRTKGTTLMRIQLIFVTGVLLLVVAACTPNRLSRSLSSSDEQQTPTSSVTVTETPTSQPDDEAPTVTVNQPEAAPLPSGRNLQPQLDPAQIDLDEVQTLLPPDVIRAILPEEVPKIMVTAVEADAGGIEPDTRVLGVSINGESRAYPIPYMSSHEIVNDEVGGRLIAATW